MYPKRVGVAVLCVLLAAGCTRKTTAPAAPTAIPLVPAAERSSYFETVNHHLELGGTLYGYAEVDGDSLKAADALHRVMKQMAAVNPAMRPYADTDFRALFTAIGMDDVKALGFSSVRGTDGNFRNREFFYTPDGRHGLLAVLGGAPAAFTRAKLAPADADFYGEYEINLAELYATVKDVVAKAGPPGAAANLDRQVKDAGIKAGLSFLDLIGAMRGRITIVARVEPGATDTFPLAMMKFVFPKYSVLACVDGIGAVMQGDLAHCPELTETVEGARHFFTLKAPSKVEGVDPVLAIEGTSFYAATSMAFLRESLDRPSGLDQNPVFQGMLATLGPTGNAVGYLTPRFFSRLRDVPDLNVALPLPFRNVLGGFLQVPVPALPLMAVRENLPDGILVRSSFNRSLKRELALLAMYNPVTLGMAAAFIIPAIQQAQHPAAVPPPQPPAPAPTVDRAITGNLRTLAILANRYYRQKHVTSATYDDLVGPGKALPTIRVWAGEDYQSIDFEKGKPISVHTGDGRLFTYPPTLRTLPPPTPVPDTPPF